MAASAAILGCAGITLTPDEARFLRDADPFGFILFARNYADKDQLKRLVADLRAAVGRPAPVLVDQEGGRVERFTGPGWSTWENAGPGLAALPDLAARKAAMRQRFRTIGADLRAVGIDVNCAPLCDIARPETHPRLAERMYGTTADEVAEIARAAAEGLEEAGVLPVMKHMPGHGRAPLDTHEALPRVSASLEALRETDLAPFRALADLPMGMSVHIVFDALDPERPVTLSPKAIATLRAETGFDGLLMTDDISMGALQGSYADRAAQALDAGCDLVLHCNGDRAEMTDLMRAVPKLEGRAAERAAAVLARRALLAPELAGV
ncbi:MAG: glycoside hydrolase family 3 protein [Pseudomonadota bacterium]